MWIFINRSVEDRKHRDLNLTLDKVEDTIRERLMTATGILYDLRGFLGVSELSPEKWRKYFEVSSLEENHPGSYSIAYVEMVRKENISVFEELMRNSGDSKYLNYMVFPKTGEDISYPIKYLHTTDPDVSVLLGFDFQYSDRTTAAFNQATLTGEPTLSELTHLDLIIPSSKKTGYEIVLPVYDRAASQIGFLGAWINSEGLMGTGVDMTGLRYSLFDGDEKIFTSGRLGGEPLTHINREVELLGHNFRVVLESDKMFKLSSFEENLPTIFLATIIVILLLWVLSVYAILSSRRRAVVLADLATRDLRKFKQAVDGVSDHVIITDPEGVIMYANKAAEEITGYGLVEMIGKKPSLWGGQMPKEFYENFWKTIKYDKRPFWGEIRNRRKSGELYEAEMRVSPILDDKENLLFFVGIERDLSKFRAIEKMKTEFISLASHQLRTPLSGVKWFVEMMLSGDAGKLTDLQTKYLSKIKESNEREIQLVNALLNVSRIESGRIIILSKKTNLKNLVESVVADIKVNIGGERNIEYDIGENLPEVEVDPDLIKHVYNNLLSNAVMYSNPGGKIEIKVYPKDGRILTEIKDNGIGIPKAEQPRVFEKFFRASNATKKVTEGTGLGLYLTKTIVESSGGKIWFTSAVGRGTTFKFWLPLKAVKGKMVEPEGGKII
ncbi:MAG: PAS/PAC sensor hybrid histidine kinase [Candidatus Collierbacteria bacterium GW2011_GWB1_44_6]|uniref:histidine kinase n=2 Tax=Candidatus Collieribacteriota TaxID=1752725 RepID=A0A0G1MIN6_9BACT|nr:MAG: PAS/PAC sensor hybrid histidine kinase [Candidatus Collierbacteria bacterium GW2011_GWC2_43_12]KKT71854.1 MAG: PAS/PAC sensor hybrid histidine kinase [Candidatus Collierbacteria bacterium GW2011_GWB1_44_6]KKT83119.1 MAG: PAS/PAC sensor hybrid histidine kinase [Microgenomates group bacterium GW2011_GWC1_44_9]